MTLRIVTSSFPWPILYRFRSVGTPGDFWAVLPAPGDRLIVRYRQRRIVGVDATVDMEGRVGRVTITRAQVHREPSEILDVAIGLVLVYLLISVLMTSVCEAIEAILKTRAGDLEQAMLQLVHVRSSAPRPASRPRRPGCCRWLIHFPSCGRPLHVRRRQPLA